MKSTLLSLLSLLLLPALLQAAEPNFKPVDGWLKPPTEMKTIGNLHGDVAVSSNGEVFVSVQGGPRKGVQVFNAAGKYLRNVPKAPHDFHGFVIHKEKGGEFIYGAQLGGQVILKMQLDGQVVLRIEGSTIPDKFVKKTKDDKTILRLTAVDVAPDGRIFAVAGYSSDFIHVFDSKGKYLNSFGGKVAPYSFKTCHKIAIDTRFSPPRIICCDRENSRVVNLSLDGKVLSEVKNLKRPAAVAIYGDWAAIGEIAGRVTLLDKAGKAVLMLGENKVKAQTATNQVKPADWRTGILTAPHGVAFDANGNLFVAEYNKYGRVLRYNRNAKPKQAAKPKREQFPPTKANVSYGPDAMNVLDFWQAKGDGPRPLLVHIHGGGWIGGDKSRHPVNIKSFLNKGISYASINYRLTGKSPLPAPVHDAARAIQLLRSKSSEWSIKSDRIALTGGSAGACTSMWLLLHDDMADPKAQDPVLRESTRVTAAAVVVGQTSIDPKVIEGWLGPNVLSHPMIYRAVGEKSMKDALKNYTKHKALYKEFSPYNHLDAKDPPLFMSYGNNMKLPSENAGHGIHHPVYGVKMKEKADSLGHECHLLIKGVSKSKYRNSVDFLMAKLLAP